MNKNFKIYPVIATVTFLHEDTVNTIKGKLLSAGIKTFNEENVEAAACFTEHMVKEGKPITFNKFLDALIPLCRIKVSCEDWNVKFKIDYQPNAKLKDTDVEKTSLSNKQMKYHFDATINKTYNLKVPRTEIPPAIPMRAVKYNFDTIEEAYDVLKNFEKRKMEIAVKGQLVTLQELGIKSGALKPLPIKDREVPTGNEAKEEQKKELNNLI